jgi:organic hydroperoxide reductase OsmC/OhrA
MPKHLAKVHWVLQGDGFLTGRYSREHSWEFDGGVRVAASPSPHVVPTPWSNPAHVDPEEAFVAAVASCHMLTFLWLASRSGFEVVEYTDHAEGVMSKNDQGVAWVSQITLQPAIRWAQTPPSPETLSHLHHEAHSQCFIANSIKTHVEVIAPVQK